MAEFKMYFSFIMFQPFGAKFFVFIYLPWNILGTLLQLFKINVFADIYHPYQRKKCTIRFAD